MVVNKTKMNHLFLKAAMDTLKEEYIGIAQKIL